MMIEMMIDFLKDFPFSFYPDVNFPFPFSSCTWAWCATGTPPRKFFLAWNIGRKQKLTVIFLGLKLAFMKWKQN